MSFYGNLFNSNPHNEIKKLLQKGVFELARSEPGELFISTIFIRPSHIDLQNEYYTVPVSPIHWKYLRFFLQGQLYQYTCLPNGLASAPHIFTKIMKPVYALLRLKGHISFGYIDDSYLQDDSFGGCKTNAEDTINLFESLGFVLHQTKPVTTPAQKLILLGFVLNSENMTVSLTLERARKNKRACNELLSKSRLIISVLLLCRMYYLHV